MKLRRRSNWKQNNSGTSSTRRSEAKDAGLQSAGSSRTQHSNRCKGNKENAYNDAPTPSIAKRRNHRQLPQDLYDFETADETNVCLKLFAVGDAVTNQAADGKKAKATSKNGITKCSQKKKPLTKKKILTSGFKHTLQMSAKKKACVPFWKRLTTGTNKVQPSIKESKATSKKDPKPRKSLSSKFPKKQDCKNVTVESMFSDSGVFMSPALSICSTSEGGSPSIILAGSQSHAATPVYQHRAVLTPPSVSPVNCVLSLSSEQSRDSVEDLMEVGLPKLKSPIAEHTYKHISMASLSSEERKQKKKRKGRYSTARFEQLAAEMNDEFDEIESFELSIEAV